MSEITIDNKLLEVLGKELMDDINVNIMNVRDKALTTSTIRAKWVMKYFKEKEQLRKLNNKKKEMIEHAIDKVQSSNISARSMSRIRLEEKIMEGSDKIKKINTLIQHQAEVIQFMEYALNIVSDFNFTVKHALDAIKLEQT